MLFDEYREKHLDRSNHSRSCEYILRHQEINNVIMHLDHKASDKLFIDFAGKKLSIVDKDSGGIIPTEVFVSILPCSQLTYVEAVAS